MSGAAANATNARRVGWVVATLGAAARVASSAIL
jgi:hypothetical protein